MSREKYLPAAVQAARKYGLDPVMFAAQIEQESNWNPNAKSKAGATGIAQFMPGTAKDFNLNPLDPLASLDAAAKYMAQLKSQLGSEDLARQAYNFGIGNVQKYQRGERALPKETAEYNTLIAKRAQNIASLVPGGVAPTAAPSSQPTAVALAPTAKTAIDRALQEINLGLPPGGLAANDMPTVRQDTAMQQLAAGNQDQWQQALASLGPQNTAQPPDMEFELLQDMQNQAGRTQDRMLANMFGDIGAQQPRENTSILPGAVDRYLDKILA